MASFAPIRGTQQEISATPRVDGQFLVETDQGNMNKIYIDTYNSGTDTVERTMAGGGGHAMTPDPSASLTEAQVVSAVSGATGDNESVASLFGVQKWSNMKKQRIIFNGTIGTTGIGEWQDELDSPTATQEAGWGWWQNNAFILPTGVSADMCDISFKFDPATNEPIALGGYIWDTTTGYICIKFANEIEDTTNAKIAVDIEYVRTDVTYDNA